MESDLEGLLEEIGIVLGRSTETEVYGLCPGHKKRLGREDRRPTSWSVSRETGTSWCFACGYSSSLLRLVVKQTGVDMWKALSLLEKYGYDPADPSDLPKTLHERHKPVTARYKQLDDDALDQFDEVPSWALNRRKISRAAADHYEVLWDPEWDAWVFPIRLVGGALLGWQIKKGRRFTNEPDGVQKSHTLFGVQVFDRDWTAILVESPLDVCRLYDAGVEGGLAAYGATISDEQMRLTLSLTDSVILALDKDDAGEKQTRKLLLGTKKTGAWSPRFESMEVFNYPPDLEEGDIGNLTYGEIDEGIVNRLSAEEWLTD